jgi:hypothetical protein
MELAIKEANMPSVSMKVLQVSIFTLRVTNTDKSLALCCYETNSKTVMISQICFVSPKLCSPLSDMNKFRLDVAATSASDAWEMS